MKHLFDLQLCHSFIYIYAELTKAARQNNKLFIGLLNKVWVGNIVDDVEKLLKIYTWIWWKLSKRWLTHVVENEAAMKRNDAILNDLPGKLYAIETDGKIPDNCKYKLATIHAAQNQKQRNRRFIFRKVA